MKKNRLIIILTAALLLQCLLISFAVFIPETRKNIILEKGREEEITLTNLYVFREYAENDEDGDYVASFDASADLSGTRQKYSTLSERNSLELYRGIDGCTGRLFFRFEDRDAGEKAYDLFNGVFPPKLKCHAIAKVKILRSGMVIEQVYIDDVTLDEYFAEYITQ